jgi:hypothetical protein
MQCLGWADGENASLIVFQAEFPGNTGFQKDMLFDRETPVAVVIEQPAKDVPNSFGASSSNRMARMVQIYRSASPIS